MEGTTLRKEGFKTRAFYDNNNYICIYIFFQDLYATVAPTVGQRWNQAETLCAARTSVVVAKASAASATASRLSPRVSRRPAESSSCQLPPTVVAAEFHMVVHSVSSFGVVC